MKIAELRTVLDRIQDLYVAAGAKAPAKDLKMVSDALAPYSGKETVTFVADLISHLSRDRCSSRSRTAVAKPLRTAPLNESAIAHHVAALRDAGTDQMTFDKAFGQVTADVSLKLPELSEIARRYANSVTKYRSLAAARNDIAKAFVRRARFENKLG